MSTVEYLNSKINSSIPITETMGIQVTSFDGRLLSLSAPLHNNINDKGTAFAGSLYSVMVISAWALIEGCLKDQGVDADVMVTESNVEFQKAVTADFATAAVFMDYDEMPDFVAILKENRKTKIDVRSQITSNCEIAVVFKGSFFVKMK